MNVDDAEVIRRAERVLYLTQWRVWEEAVLARLALTRGLAAAPLLPGSDVIYLVTYDGEHLGHARREGPRTRGECWVAVPLMEMPLAGQHHSAEAAARALARACHGRTAHVGGCGLVHEYPFRIYLQS